MKHSTAGFTYIEILLSSVLMGLVIMGVARLSQLFFSGYSFSLNETMAISEAQNAMATMEREIREMRDGEDGSYPLAIAGETELVFFADTNNDDLVDRIRYYLVGNYLMKQVFYYLPGTTNYACVGGCDICHNESETITIPEPAWPAHSQHGDYLGACVPGGPLEGGSDATATEKIVASYIHNSPATPLFEYYNGDWPGDTDNNPLPDGERLLNTRLIKPTVVVNVDPANLPGDVIVSTIIHLRNLKDNL